MHFILIKASRPASLSSRTIFLENINIELFLLDNAADYWLNNSEWEKYHIIKFYKTLFGSIDVIVSCSNQSGHINFFYDSEGLWKTFSFNKELDDLIKLKRLID